METTIAQKSVYETVTEHFTNALLEGTLLWRTPFAESGLPQNFITHVPYRDINIWLLASLGYQKNFFLTAKEVESIGGTIKEGEQGHLIVSGNVFGKGCFFGYPLLYNISQCEGIPSALMPSVESERHAIFMYGEEFMKNMPHPPEVQHREQTAYYHPIHDTVNLPVIDRYEDIVGYFNDLFHQLVHSTGHPKRLNRREIQDSKKFSCNSYSLEELTADIGASYLRSYTGMTEPDERYTLGDIKGWLERLEGDTRCIFYACTYAQQAVDYILATPSATKEIVHEMPTTKARI